MHNPANPEYTPLDNQHYSMLNLDEEDKEEECSGTENLKVDILSCIETKLYGIYIAERDPLAVMVVPVLGCKHV